MMLWRTHQNAPLSLRKQIVVISQVSIALCLLMYVVTRVERRVDHFTEDDNDVFQYQPNYTSFSLTCTATSRSIDKTFVHAGPLLFPFPKILKADKKLHNGDVENYFQYISISQVFNIDYTGISSRKGTKILEILKQLCKFYVPINYLHEKSTRNVTSHTIFYIVDSINFHLDDKIPEIFKQQIMHETLFFENMDEFYELTLDENKRTNCTSTDRFSNFLDIQYKCASVNIFITTAKGVSNAISTLSQLLAHRQAIASNQVLNVSTSSSQILKIIDWPENHWRGLLLDVSRHFQPMKLLKRCIDAMQSSKLNTLHLHLTDSQSFPVLLDDVNVSMGSHGEEMLLLSNLAKKGSFSPEKMYTKSDLLELVAYGRVRGVDVVPEIDMPAHTLSWGNAFKDVYINCSRTARSAQTPWNIYPLDPSKEKTYAIIYHVLAQVADIFPSRYLHIGGDEVSEQCWREDDELMSWAKEKGFATRDISKYFEERVFSIVYSLGKVPIIWQGILDSHSMPAGESYAANRSYTRKSAGSDDDGNVESRGDSNREPVVEPWKCWGGLALRAATKAVEGGHPVIMSACWYLDYNQDWSAFLATDISTTAAIAVAAYNSRSSVESSKGTKANMPATARRGRRLAAMSTVHDSLKHRNYFFGGEAAMWTEMVDHTNLECRMWPRAAAIAARLWGLGQEFNSAKYSENNRIDPFSNDSTAIPSYLLNLPQTIQLNAEQTQLLYASFVSFRFHLFNSLGVSAAPLVFHFADGKSPPRMYSIEVADEADALR